MGDEGLETSGSNAGKTAFSDISGPSGGPILFDPELAALISRWPELPEAERKNILQIAGVS